MPDFAFHKNAHATTYQFDFDLTCKNGNEPRWLAGMRFIEVGKVLTSHLGSTPQFS